MHGNAGATSKLIYTNYSKLMPQISLWSHHIQVSELYVMLDSICDLLHIRVRDGRLYIHGCLSPSGGHVDRVFTYSKASWTAHTKHVMHAEHCDPPLC